MVGVRGHVLIAMLHCNVASYFTEKSKKLMCCSLSKRQGLLGCIAALQAILHLCTESSELEQGSTFTARLLEIDVISSNYTRFLSGCDLHSD